ncbi:MAG TPA: ectonucleotide pyrophosphatase/phosphodiesterase [Rhizomicrobium sp.]|nr:ectonucleotide pyrophosphatase/phosphodiesterase [Rhizomicrobium sp.]
MKVSAFVSCLFAAATIAAAAGANPVLMISIDGLRPADVLDAQKRGLKVPNLRAFLAESAYATGVRNVVPTVTYPNHTTLVTGVAPALHGIANNVTFDPYRKNLEGWYWYSSDIKVPTLWDEVHAKHQVTASVAWPVSAGNRSIDYDLPEYWRALTMDDLKLIAALSTPGLIDTLQQDTGIPLAAAMQEDAAGDAVRARYSEALFERVHPEFMTVHLASLDAMQHEEGPGTPQAHATLEAIDTMVGSLIARARKAEPDVDIAIVSDHGFAAVDKEVNLPAAFAAVGLIGVDPVKHKIAGWDAMPWNAGGSAPIVLAHPEDQAVQAKVADLLAKLAADPSSGIAKVIDRRGIEALGGAKEASFWVDFKIGYYGGDNLDGALVTPADLKGHHGYLNDHPEMRATFMIAGPGIKKRALGEIDMRDIAPTLAKLMDVPLPDATGKPLF